MNLVYTGMNEDDPHADPGELSARGALCRARPHAAPCSEPAMAQAAPATAAEMQNSVKGKRAAGLATMRGTQARSVNMLIIIASAVAARRGRTPKRMPSPAAMCPAPVR